MVSHADAANSRNRQRRRSGRALSWAAAAVFVASGTAGAQVSLAVSPVRVELAVVPGQTKTDILTVQNLGEKPQHVRVSVADWYLTKDGTPVFVKAGKAPEFSMSEWVEVNPTELQIGPQGSQVLRYTVTVPAGVAAAGYRSAILVETVPEMVAGQTANVTYLNARIGVVLYNRVGTLPIMAEITDQQVVPDPANSGRLAVRLTLKNGGTSHYRFRGQSLVQDAEGKTVQTLTVSDAVVLPQSEREVFVPFEGPPPAGSYTVTSRLDVGLKELLEIVTRITPIAAPQ